MDENFKRLMQTVERADISASLSCGVAHTVRANESSEEFELTPREIAIFNIGASEGVLCMANRLHEENYAIFTDDGKPVIWESEPGPAYVEGLWRDVSN